MTWEIVFVLGVTVLAVVLFVSERLRTDVVAVLVMALILCSGVVTPEEGLAGFANTATVTVAAMFVLSAGLHSTGAVTIVATFLRGLSRRSFPLLLATIMVTVGVLSAFLNNTAAVAILIPVVIGVARDAGQSPSRLLMPLSFASMFGGICTLIGTSTNILASSIAVRHGMAPLGMFEFSALGLVLFTVGIAYMLLVGVHLVPAREVSGGLTERFGMSDFLTEVSLAEGAPSVGKRLVEAPLVTELKLEVLELVRGDVRMILPSPHAVLRAGDVLRVRGVVSEIAKLQEREGVTLVQRTLNDEDMTDEQAKLVEAIVAPTSPLAGRTLQQVRFRERYGGTVLALRHRNTLLRSNLEQTPLRPGDSLLVEVRTEQLEQLRSHRGFVLISEVRLPPMRGRLMPLSLAIMSAVVVSAALGLAPIVVSSVAGAVLMVLLGCLAPDEAYEAIDWQVIFLLAGLLSLGAALEQTGAAELLAGALTSLVGDFGPTALLSALYLLTFVLTSVMSNNATVALFAPIAIATAQEFGVSPRPMLIAVMLAASSSFLTPIGYQTNTMIYLPGQYRFSDFLKVGTPLSVVFWVIATFLVPVFFPF